MPPGDRTAPYPSQLPNAFGEGGDDDYLLAAWTRRNGRDLASPEVWEQSELRARLKRRAAANRPRLPQARSRSASLVAAAAAATAAVAAPSGSLAHSRTGTSVAAKSTKRGTLEIRDRGKRVAELQRLLGINADGVFGPKTRSAVRSFQSRHGLAVDGVVGPKTWRALTRGSAETRGSGEAKPGDGILERGDRGPRVKKLQRLLGIPADGVFGPQTRRSVRSFQARHGLVVDGQVGPQTWRALDRKGSGSRNGARGDAKPGDGILERGDRGPRVKKLQRLLNIPADGIFGPQTRRTVRSFQSRHGLVVDGKVGPRTWAALRKSGGGAGPTNSSSSAGSHGPKSVDRRLWGALRLAKRHGLTLMSAYRPGSSISGSGNPSDHSYSPSRAIDVGGSKAAMARYARAVAGKRGVEIVIYGPVGIWISGIGWREITSQGTYRDHLDHVHVDTF